MQPPVVPCLMAALLAACCVSVLLPTGRAQPVLRAHPFSRAKRSYLDIECRGVFNKSIYVKLNNICKDCYELYKDPELHGLCRQDCFGSRFFGGCVQALQLTANSATYRKWIRSLRGNQFR